MEVESLYDVSTRTKIKILQRIGMKCSQCGWDKASCDLHHIIPRSKGGTNDHSNLTCLCPNCHRLAHANKIETYISIEEQYGDSWKQYYFPRKAKSSGFDKTERIADRRSKEQKALEKQQKIDKILETLHSSGIDFSLFGWVEKASKVIGIPPQKVGEWMYINDKVFYESSCFRRKRYTTQLNLI